MERDSCTPLYSAQSLASALLRCTSVSQLDGTPHFDRASRLLPASRGVVQQGAEAARAVASRGWRDRLPVLTGARVTLRELELSDAPALMAAVGTGEASRFISPPPSSLPGFERFILWAQRGRAEGRLACFAVVPDGSDRAVGLFQVRQLEAGFSTAEWGFVIASDFWGTGVFTHGARLVVDFVVDVIGARRLEARAAVLNGRGNGALRKIGAIEEKTLPRSIIQDGVYVDQVLWSIVADEWRRAKTDRRSSCVH